MSEKRKKPVFLRKDWHKRISLGKTVKKLRKWRGAKGRHNKIRTKQKGHAQKPTIGWGAKKELKGKINNKDYTLIKNLQELGKVKKGHLVLIGKVGIKKRQEIIVKAKELELIILNKYIKKKNEA